MGRAKALVSINRKALNQVSFGAALSRFGFINVHG